MSKIKINSVVDNNSTNEKEVLNKANSLIKDLVKSNKDKFGDNVITKLHYFAIQLDMAVTLFSDEDAKRLGLDNNILKTERLSNIPLTNIPTSVLNYKEIIVPKGIMMSNDEIMDAAQSIVDGTQDSIPNKINIIKMVDLNNGGNETIHMPSIFGNNIPSSVETPIFTGGSSKKGKEILNKLNSSLYGKNYKG